MQLMLSKDPVIKNDRTRMLNCCCASCTFQVTIKYVATIDMTALEVRLVG